jgi:hypothetical protein
MAPDVMLIQQIDGKGSGAHPVEWVENALSQRFPGEKWNTIVAEKSPAYWAGANCPDKHYQTNGIIYRTKRLDYIAGTKKTLMAHKNVNGSCVVATLPRNLGVFAKFGDRLNGTNANGGYVREVAIASVHWPVEDGCGVTNANQTDDLLLTYTGAQMYLWGGDINLPDKDSSGVLPWYERANTELGAPGNRGYRDPIWQACGGQWACVATHHTFNTRRYDFLFVKYKTAYKSGLSPTSGAGTIEADPDHDGQAYSQHESVHSYVHW